MRLKKPKVTNMESVMKIKTISIVDLMSPVHSLESIMGMNPFKFTMISGKPETLFSIPFSILTIWLLSVYYYSVVQVVQIGHLKRLGKMYMYSELGQIYVGFLTITLINILKYLKRNYFISYFEIAEKLSNSFMGLGNQKNYRSLSIKFFIASILQFVFCISLLLLSYVATRTLPVYDRLPAIITLWWPSCTIAMTQFIASSFFHITWLNLHMLNEEISKLLQMPPLIFPVTVNSNNLNGKIKQSLLLQRTKPKNLLEKLDLIWKAYSQICTNGNNLEKDFCFTLLLAVALSFMNTLFNAFYASRNISVIHKFTQLYGILLLRLTKCLMNTIYMLLLATRCNDCEKEVSLLVNAHIRQTFTFFTLYPY